MNRKLFFNRTTTSLFAVVLLVFMLVSCDKKETEKEQEDKFHIITSTVEGGNWSDIKTWQENQIPDEFTDVNITGRVVLTDTAECLNLMVDAGAHLIVEKTGFLKIKHHAINEGTIINNGKILLREEEK